MKNKNFETPKHEIIHLKNNDIITASSIGGGRDNTPGGNTTPSLGDIFGDLFGGIGDLIPGIGSNK